MRSSRLFPFSLALLFCVLGSLSSCSIQFEKRRYTKGYHYSVIKRPKRTGNSSVSNPKIQEKPVNNVFHMPLDSSLAAQPETPGPLLNTEQKPASSSYSTRQKLPGSRFKLNAPKQERTLKECDEIILKDGSKILAKVESASKKEIVYFDCGDDEQESAKTIACSKISHVNYAEGGRFDPRDAFGGEKLSTEKYNQVGASYNITSFALGLAAVIVALLALIFSFISIVTAAAPVIAIVLMIIAVALAIAALVTGIKGLKYGKKGFAIAGIIMAGIALVFALYALIYSIFLLLVL